LARERRPSLLPPGASVVVEVTGLDDEGRGRGHVDSAGTIVDVAVRGAFPGDRVRASVQRVYPKIPLLVARMRDVLTPGDARVDPRCPNPAPCLGCPLDPLIPSAEVDLKRGLVSAALEGMDIEIDDVLVPERDLGRRQKVKLVPGKNGALGLYAPHSHHVVDAHACARHHPALVAALRQVKDALGPDARDVKAVVARVFREGVAMVIVTPRALEDRIWFALTDLYATGALAGIAERVDPRDTNSVVGGTITRSHGGPWFSPLGHAGARETVDHFCQPDPWLAEEMYALCAGWVREGGERAVDLYAGSGGFTRHLVERGCEVVAVEENPICERSLVENGARPVVGTVFDALGSLGEVDGVVADPPRKGLREDTEGILKLDAKRIALVSCDTRALTRDLTALQAGGYRVARVVPVDLFAGAPRIEVVTLLERA
jgi:23S rRNA (uracil1939-C5)-methyltransferase